jgi:hypothetical protein
MRYELHVWEAPVLSTRSDALGPIAVATEVILTQGVDYDSWKRTDGELILGKNIQVMIEGELVNKIVPVMVWVSGAYLKVWEVPVAEENVVTNLSFDVFTSNEIVASPSIPFDLSDSFKDAPIDFVDEPAGTFISPISSKEVAVKIEANTAIVAIVKGDEIKPLEEIDPDLAEMVKALKAPAPPVVVIAATRQQQREAALAEIGDQGHNDHVERTSEVMTVEVVKAEEETDAPVSE